MSDEILTLAKLNKIKDKIKLQEPFSKPMVGIVINEGAWTAIKEEIESNSPHFIYDESLKGVDMLWGAVVYPVDISPTYVEIYFDKEVLNARLKELKIQ